MKPATTGILATLSLLTATAVTLPAAMAGEPAPQIDRAAVAESAAASRNRAADAQVEAVAKAADAVVSATKLDLDIRLVSHTSEQVASDAR